MPHLLATDTVPWIVGVVIVSVLALLLIIVAPWRAVRREPPLAKEIESRLLLGEDPDEIGRDLAARDTPGAPVTDLHPPGNDEVPEDAAETEADPPEA